MGQISKGIDLIAAERAEQIKKHGVTVCDDKFNNKNGQLHYAACTLLKSTIPTKITIGHNSFISIRDTCPDGWNVNMWEKMCNKSYKERLIIAGALIAAEIDRIN